MAARIWLFFSLTLLGLAAVAWANDVVTLQGERTVYTATCEGGSWQGMHCSGTLAAAQRYRFRALKPHREVVYWTVGSTAPSAKFTDCTIDDGRNWTCKSSAESAGAITHAMVHGSPASDAASLALPFRPVTKWHWMLLRWGLAFGHNAGG
ncbi:MAG TPA: hypothetical protein VJ598_08845 [Albitalea sp.]|nr:hypothetical protein [Albitalea sp.]